MAALALTGLGCEAAAPGPMVFIDFDAALIATTSTPAVANALPNPPAAQPAKTLAIPGTLGRTLTVDSSQERQVIERNRERAERELSRSLATLYQREAERAGQERLKELEPSRQEALRAAQDAVRIAFEAYALKRGPKVARLTAIVGFPDPNPDSLPPTREPDAAVKPRLEEAVALRAEIRTLAREYEVRSQELLAEAERRHDVDLTEAKAEIGRLRVGAIERAEQEAVAEIARSHSELQSLLIPSTTVELPATPPQSRTLPAEPPYDRAPAVDARVLTKQERRQLLVSQATIWAGARGYVIVDRGGRDATAEFVAWVKDKRL